MVRQYVTTKTYTVEELEDMGLWTNIEAKIDAIGSCEGGVLNE
jgi:hypothetical protein